MCGYICNNCGRCRGEGSWVNTGGANTCFMCGTANEPGAKVCAKCGGPMPIPPGAGK